MLCDNPEQIAADWKAGALNEVFYLLSSGMALEWGELQVCVSPPERWNIS